MSQIDFIKYELTTGKIISNYSCPQYAYTANAPPSTNIGYLNSATVDASGFYVLGGVIVERPTLNLPANPIAIQANGVDSFELTGLPQGTIVTIGSDINDDDAETHTIDDGVLSFSTEIPDSYTLRINPFPYQQATVIIEASL